MSKPAHVRLSTGDLIAEGSDLSREAWRDAWAPMLLVIAGHTLMFMNQHVAASDWHAGIWTFVGPALLIRLVIAAKGSQKPAPRSATPYAAPAKRGR